MKDHVTLKAAEGHTSGAQGFWTSCILAKCHPETLERLQLRGCNLQGDLAELQRYSLKVLKLSGNVSSSMRSLIWTCLEFLDLRNTAVTGNISELTSGGPAAVQQGSRRLRVVVQKQEPDLLARAGHRRLQCHRWSVARPKRHWPESAEAGSLRDISELQSFWLACLFVAGSFLLRSSCWINEFRVHGLRGRGDFQHVGAHQSAPQRGPEAVSPAWEAGHLRQSVGHGRLGLPVSACKHLLPVRDRFMLQRDAGLSGGGGSREFGAGRSETFRNMLAIPHRANAPNQGECAGSIGACGCLYCLRQRASGAQ